MSNIKAPPGAIWVCGACGKTAPDQYGEDPETSPWWDESCVINSVLCDEASLEYDDNGRVIHAKEFGEPLPKFDGDATDIKEVKDA